MWPSQEWASRLYDLANWGLIVGLIIGVVSTGLLVWMGNVKEEYLGREIALVNQRAAEANQIAEGERLARLRLEQKLAPRILTVAQGASLVAELKAFPNQKYEFVTYQDDKEAMGFAGQINAVLQAAGWKVEPSKGFLAFMLEFGISAMVDPASSPETQKAADAFVRTFNEQGVSTTKKTASGPTGEPETIQVRVGKKM